MLRVSSCGGRDERAHEMRMDEAMQVAESAVQEFLLFRGFTTTLQAFSSDLRSDASSGYQASRILDLIFRVHVPSFEVEKLVDLLTALNSLVATSADGWLQQTAKKLECSLKRYYIVHALRRGRTDRVLEFFKQYGEGLLRSGDHDWLLWFAIPYMGDPASDPNFKEYFSSQWSNSLEHSLRKFLHEMFSGIILRWKRVPALLKFGAAESKCEALEKELEQLREKLKVKDDEIAYLRRDSSRHDSSRFKNLVPAGFRVSSSVTHSKSPLSSGGSVEERENEADHESAPKQENSLFSTYSGDFSESGKSPERTSSSRWRPLSRKNSSIRSTYSGGSEPERFDSDGSDAANSREKKGDVVHVAVKYQETFSGSTSPITKCRYSASGASIAVASADGTLRIWSPDGVAPSKKATISAGAEVLSLEWEPMSDRLLLLGTAERNIKAWNVESERVVCDLTTEAMFPRVLDLRCSPTSSVFCCAAASEITTPGEGVDGFGYGSLTIWNMRTWKAMISLPLGQEPPVMTSVCFNENGKLLAAGATDGKIRIFDLRENVPKIGWPAHAGCAVSCVRFGHDSSSVFSLGADGKIFEWSLHNQGQILHVANASSYCALAPGVLPRHEFAVGSGGRHVLLTSNTTTAPLYQWRGSLTPNALEHTGLITSVDRHPSSPGLFISSCADYSVRVTAVG